MHLCVVYAFHTRLFCCFYSFGSYVCAFCVNLFFFFAQLQWWFGLLSHAFNQIIKWQKKNARLMRVLSHFHSVGRPQEITQTTARYKCNGLSKMRHLILYINGKTVIIYSIRCNLHNHFCQWEYKPCVQFKLSTVCYQLAESHFSFDLLLNPTTVNTFIFIDHFNFAWAIPWAHFVVETIFSECLIYANGPMYVVYFIWPKIPDIICW